MSLENRRSVLQKTASLVTLVIAQPSAAAAEVTSKAGDGSSIAQLITLAHPGDVVYIPGGIYRERLIVDKPIELRSAPGQKVEIIWETEEHYESTLVCSTSEGAVINGVTLRHASPSVANNYAVQILPGSKIKLTGCDISSSTGSGLGIEGGDVVIDECRIHNCSSSGIMIFGDPLGGEGETTVRGSTIEGNRLHGIVVRQGAAPTITGNGMSNNGKFGLALQDCGGIVENNTFSGNKKGAVAYKLLDGIDIVDLAKKNGIDESQLIETSL